MFSVVWLFVVWFLGFLPLWVKIVTACIAGIGFITKATMQIAKFLRYANSI